MIQVYLYLDVDIQQENQHVTLIKRCLFTTACALSLGTVAIVTQAAQAVPLAASPLMEWNGCPSVPLHRADHPDNSRCCVTIGFDASGMRNISLSLSNLEM